jgi:hypothetical protein
VFDLAVVNLTVCSCGESNVFTLTTLLLERVLSLGGVRTLKSKATFDITT